MPVRVRDLNKIISSTYASVGCSASIRFEMMVCSVHHVHHIQTVLSNQRLIAFEPSLNVYLKI